MPERFLGDWPRDAFIPFSLGKHPFSSLHPIITRELFAGARACLGRRCELVAMLPTEGRESHLCFFFFLGSSKLKV